jgi:hypothetical protein
MLTDLQKKTAAAIVNIFETGRVLGDYGALATLPRDTVCTAEPIPLDFARVHLRLVFP